MYIHSLYTQLHRLGDNHNDNDNEDDLLIPKFMFMGISNENIWLQK